MSQAEKSKEKPKKLVQGDDAIDDFEADWFDFKTPAVELTKQLYTISKSSGICCGIIGSWGSGNSSFMKLMDEYIRKEPSWKNVHRAWFTAWDPGGIQDSGDAMLYHFFSDVVGDNKDIAGAFKELQEALGIRRSFRERTRQALEGVSKALPETGQAAIAIAGGLLDSSRKVQRSFERLMEWLEKEEQTVFFFIDDIDRATGEQIRDLLSELKLYVSHRRIIAVLGYDEDYVLGALKSPVLPQGIDPNKYIEKIVTVKRNVPIPTTRNLGVYAANLINSILDLPKHAEILGMAAARLSFNNPRRLKNLILAFTQFALSLEYKKFEYIHLRSMLFATTAVNMGFLDDKIMETMETGNEDDIVSAIREFAKKDPSKSKEANVLIEEVEKIKPEFVPHIVSELRLAGVLPSIYSSIESVSRHEGFDWSLSLTPILSSAAKRGFKLPPDIVESSNEIGIVPPAETEELDIKYKELPLKRQSTIQRIGKSNCVVSWNQNDMSVLLSSTFSGLPSRYLEPFFDECPYFTVEKTHILWLIDDNNSFLEDSLKRLIKRAQELSKGLKHPFIFQYTPSSKVRPLLEFLLSIVTKQS
jgi:hypothetical protein